MTTGLRRYAFSERLADILGESRRDLRVRVTLMISDGLVAAGARGPGSPPTTPEYAADLLLGVMAAPQQVHTVEAIRCYRELRPSRIAAGESATGIVLGVARRAVPAELPEWPLLAGAPRFGAALARLLDLARDEERRSWLVRELLGVWVSRGFPAAALQRAAWVDGRSSVVSQRYELPDGARPPAWLDPDRGGIADFGLLHSVFLPINKLIEIGTLTTASKEERTPVVLDLGQKIVNLAQLARNGRNRRSWEKFLSVAALAEDQAERIDPQSRGLVEVTGFGSNPGNLRMLTHVPEDLPAGAGLVVVLHGCTQTAASYDTGTGWSTLADRHGFAVLLPEQRRSNNPLRCFNWFRAEDYQRDSGEPLSIRQMIERMIADHGIDPSRVFVTGLSAGGAMTSVMLATYPEVFAGGAVLSGVPYRCANGLQEGFEVIFQGCSRPALEWGERVRAASAHPGPWPHVQVWHGDADTTVKPINALEICKQWADVHGLPTQHTDEDTVEGQRHLVWRTADGNNRVELFSIAGMAHGAAIDPYGEDGCGTPAPFILDVGISSTQHIARSWGLTATRRETAPRPRPAAAADRVPPAADMPGEIYVPPAAGRREGAGREARTAAGAGIDLQAILAKSLEAASRLKNASSTGGTAPGGGAGGGLAGLGIDIPAILGKSFEAAGLLKSGRGAAATPPSGATVAGVDIGAILAKSFEAAGLLNTGDDTPPPPPAGGSEDLAAAGWEGDGWQILAGTSAPGQSQTLFGYASSGIGCDVGNKVRSVSCRLSLGAHPRLSYSRKLDLGAAVNMLTTATFRVLVDGEAVDEVLSTGMSYVESDWTERAAIDLARFAGRTVTLTFEVAANSNVCIEVSAKAWIRDLLVQDSVTPGKA